MEAKPYLIIKPKERANNLASYLRDHMSDIGIVQVGIVDCAPRPVPYEGRQRIGRPPTPRTN